MPSMPNYGSFDPPESTADEDTLSAEAEALEANSGRIVGSGDNLVSDMRSTAVDFSEIVSDPLQREAGNSTSAYLAAMQGAAWGAMVTGKWASDVKTYKTRREELIEEWEEAVDDDFGVDRAALGSEIGTDAPSMTADAVDRAVESAVAEAGQAKLTEMEGEAETAYEEYKDNASEAGRMLTAGPSPEDLRVLTGGGAASWMAFNLWGTDAALPVTGSDGRDLGEALAEAMRNGDELTPELRAQLEYLNAIADRAQEFQDIDGAELSPGELDFLEAFYAHMDSVNGREPSPDSIQEHSSPLYFVAEWAENSESMDPADKLLVTGALGGGLLALSNERVGGGFDRLPTNLQWTLDSQDGDAPGTLLTPDTAKVLVGLAPLMEAVLNNGDRTDMEGGTHFSSALTVALADHLFPTADGYGGYSQEEFENAATDLLGISTRNIDANADLLGGDYQHHEYGDATAEFVTRGLFGHNWLDGGAAATSLIDWIPEASYADDEHDRERAAEAAFGLFTTMSNREATHWETSAYDFFTDGYGPIDGDPAANLGLGNPEVSRALGEVTFRYLPHFGDEPQDNEFAWDPDDMTFRLDEETRVGVFELVMGDEEAANTLGGRVYAVAMGDAESLHDWDGKREAEMHAATNGRLIGLLDGAYDNLVADTLGAINDEDSATAAGEARHAAWSRAGASILKEAVGELPGVRSLGTGGRILIKEILEAPKWGVPLGQAEGWWFSSDTSDTSSVGSEPLSQRYSELNFNVRHSAIDGMLTDPDSGLTIERVREIAEESGVDPDLVVDGDELVSPEVTLDGEYDDVGGVYTAILEERGLDELYENFRDAMNGESNDTRAATQN